MICWTLQREIKKKSLIAFFHHSGPFNRLLCSLGYTPLSCSLLSLPFEYYSRLHSLLTYTILPLGVIFFENTFFLLVYNFSAYQKFFKHMVLKRIPIEK
jgi:hypothetical protein